MQVTMFVFLQIFFRNKNWRTSLGYSPGWGIFTNNALFMNTNVICVMQIMWAVVYMQTPMHNEHHPRRPRPGATRLDEAISSGVSLLQELKSPWELIPTEPVPEVIEYCPADWPAGSFCHRLTRSGFLHRSTCLATASLRFPWLRGIFFSETLHENNLNPHPHFNCRKNGALRV